MHIKLLRKVGKTADASSWQRVLLRFIALNSVARIDAPIYEEDDDEEEENDYNNSEERGKVETSTVAEEKVVDDDSNFAGESYDALPLAKRLSLLRELLEHQLDLNQTVKRHIAESYKGNLWDLRLKSLGVDSANNVYWLFEDRNGGLRLYKESTPSASTSPDQGSANDHPHHHHSIKLPDGASAFDKVSNWENVGVTILDLENFVKKWEMSRHSGELKIWAAVRPRLAVLDRLQKAW